MVRTGLRQAKLPFRLVLAYFGAHSLVSNSLIEWLTFIVLLLKADSYMSYGTCTIY